MCGGGGGDEGVTDLISCSLSCYLNGVLIGRGCVNRQLAEECLYKGTHGETVLEMRPSLFTTSAPKLKKRTEERMRKRKKTRGRMGLAEWGEVSHATTEWSGVEIDKTEREGGKGIEGADEK